VDPSSVIPVFSDGNSGAHGNATLPPVRLEHWGVKGRYSGAAGAEYSPQCTEEILMADDLKDIYSNWLKNYLPDPAFGESHLLQQ
jgi:hypothetical protein